MKTLTMGSRMELILCREEIKHPLDKPYWIVSHRCWEQLWEEAVVSPGTENNVLYLHRELRK